MKGFGASESFSAILTGLPSSSGWSVRSGFFHACMLSFMRIAGLHSFVGCHDALTPRGRKEVEILMLLFLLFRHWFRWY